MKCYQHPENDTVGACTVCGRGICSVCAVETQGRLVCRQCLAKGATPAGRSAKDPDTAFLIELVGGFFGLLGLGYFYAGRTNDGILRLILWWVWVGIATVGVILLAATVVGLVCLPVPLVIQIGVPIWSALQLKKEMQQSRVL